MEQQGCSALTSAQRLRGSHSVDHRPSSGASGIVSFDGSKEESDNSMSLAASDTVELANSCDDSTHPQLK